MSRKSNKVTTTVCKCNIANKKNTYATNSMQNTSTWASKTVLC